MTLWIAAAAIDDLVSKTADYPAWAKAIFLATLVLVLVAGFVYARYFAEADRRRRAAEPRAEK